LRRPVPSGDPPLFVVGAAVQIWSKTARCDTALDHEEHHHDYQNNPKPPAYRQRKVDDQAIGPARMGGRPASRWASSPDRYGHQEFKCSKSTAKCEIAGLRAKERIEFIGKGRAGHYEFKKPVQADSRSI